MIGKKIAAGVSFSEHKAFLPLSIYLFIHLSVYSFIPAELTHLILAQIFSQHVYHLRLIIAFHIKSVNCLHFLI